MFAAISFLLASLLTTFLIFCGKGRRTTTGPPGKAAGAKPGTKKDKNPVRDSKVKRSAAPKNNATSKMVPPTSVMKKPDEKPKDTKNEKTVMKPVVEPKKEEKAPMTMRGKLDPKTCIGTLTVKEDEKKPEGAPKEKKPKGKGLVTEVTDEFPTVDGENKEGEKKDEKKEDKKEDNAKKEEEERKEKEAEAERKRKEDKEHRKNAKRDSDGPKMTGKEAASKKDPNVISNPIVTPVTDEFPTDEEEVKKREEEEKKKAAEKKAEKENAEEKRKKDEKEHKKNAKRDPDGPRMTGKEAASKKDPNIISNPIVTPVTDEFPTDEEEVKKREEEEKKKAEEKKAKETEEAKTKTGAKPPAGAAPAGKKEAEEAKTKPGAKPKPPAQPPGGATPNAAKATRTADEVELVVKPKPKAAAGGGKSQMKPK